jgi:hypothetical protein
MKRFAYLVFAVLTLFPLTMCAQDKDKNLVVKIDEKPKPVVTEKLQPVPMSREAENRILKAEHAHDQIARQETELNLQMQQLQLQAQNQWNALDAKAKELGPKEVSTSKDIEAAIEQAWKESGLDKTKYDVDAADFTFKPKLPAAQAKK